MALDKTFFEDLEARIPKGKVRTRFAPSPTGYMHVGNLPATPTAPSFSGSRIRIRAVWWRVLRT